jgi:uncharacterized integral membrane protein
MRIKTIIVILITILLTIVLMQNTGPVTFSVLWADFRVPKLVMLTAVSVFAFILGVLVGRPKNVRRIGGDFVDDDNYKGDSNTLSDEDREYIS